MSITVILNPKVTSSNYLFCPTNCPKPKDVKCIIRHRKAANPPNLTVGTRQCLVFVLEELFKHLIDHQINC